MAFIQEAQDNLTAKFADFMKNQTLGVEVAVTTAGGALQGGFFGGLMGVMMKNQPAPPPGVTPPPQPAAMLGGPFALGRNVAVMTGVNAGLSLLIKRLRNGKEDWKNGAGASFGAGFCYSIVSNLGAPKNLPAGVMLPPSTPGALIIDAVRTGLLFAGLQSAFYAIGNQFSKPKEPDTRFRATTEMLTALGLEKYEKNFKKGLLTDNTLTLLTESTLSEVRIPPGPRLLILNHVESIKEYQTKVYGKGKAMSLAMPVPGQPAGYMTAN